MESLVINGSLAKVNVVPIIGDGNCLFRSISYHVYGTEDRHLEVRKLVVNWVLRNWETMQGETVDRYGHPYTSPAEYKRVMMTPREYGAASEFTAAAHEFNISIEVFYEGRMMDRYGQSVNVARLKFTTWGGGHYEVYKVVQTTTTQALQTESPIPVGPSVPKKNYSSVLKSNHASIKNEGKIQNQCTASDQDQTKAARGINNRKNGTKEHLQETVMKNGNVRATQAHKINTNNGLDDEFILVQSKKRKRPHQLTQSDQVKHTLKNTTDVSNNTIVKNNTTEICIKNSGRPFKKKRGRPKVSHLTPQEQHRISVTKYSKKNPNVHRTAVSKYNKQNPEISRAAREERKKRKRPHQLTQSDQVKHTLKNTTDVSNNTIVKNNTTEICIKNSGRPFKKKRGRPKVSHLTPQEQHRISFSKYSKKNPNVRKTAVSKYNNQNPEVSRAAVIRCRKKKPEIIQKAVHIYNTINFAKRREAFLRYRDKNSTANLQAVKCHRLIRRAKMVILKNAIKKIRNERGKLTTKSTIKLKINNQHTLKQLQFKLKGSNVGKKCLEAENMLKWCIQFRKKQTSHFERSALLTKSFIEGVLTKLNNANLNQSSFGVFQEVFGPSLHVSTQEPYYADTAYESIPETKTVTLNARGMAIDVFPVPKITNKRYKNVHNVWSCSTNICKFHNELISRLKTLFLKYMKNYIEMIWVMDLKNLIEIIRRISPHFPKLRTLCRQLYEMACDVEMTRKVDKALKTCNIDEMKRYASEAQSNLYIHDLVKNKEFPEIEDDIISKHKNAFERFKKLSRDLPIHDCISCHKLCCRKDGTLIGRLKKPLDTPAWRNLLSHSSISNNLSPNYFICNYCLKKYRANKIPPTSIMNDLFVSARPQELRKLNDFEKSLIQRAKAFQVVVNMHPVGNKKVPNRQLVKKVRGRTFHLPLPLEQTLAKLPSHNDAINNTELFILLRGVPTKTNIVWEDLVNVGNIYNALTTLKQTNPLYAEIILPPQPEELLIGKDLDIHILNEDEHEKVIEVVSDNADAMITQMDGEKDIKDYYTNYTIYPIHEHRKNVSTTSLYQTLKVIAEPMDSRDTLLDVKCFPDLYFEGKFGQCHPRKHLLTHAEYVKCRLMSKHSQFRLNQQYLFFLLNETNIRQLSAGIFYKMNISNYNSKLKAAEYISKLSNDELEGDLSAIFSRLRNTEQFWKRPRNDVNCMTQHYGPATWFLTLSPSEWLWDDLGEYIKECNVLSLINKLTSELVALDPVSASRFINIQFKAVLEFITSSDEPLGKVIHYFWRREYQTRGLQHFHLLLWCESAPILGTSPLDEVGEFLNKFLSCSIPDPKKFPTLNKRVNQFLKHHHNSYCMRTKKTKCGVRKVCRFGFPRAPTDTLIIRDIAESIANRSTLNSGNRLYSLPRKENEIFINDYNPAIMLAWNGNMDLQFVGEKSSVLNFYITKYTTKSEKGHAVDAFDQITSTKSLNSRLFSIGMRALNHRECGALEASDTLLGIPLFGTDSKTSIRWLDTSIDRKRRVKSKKEIEKLDPESTDLYYASFVDDYYPNRPESLDTINLYDFYRWFDKVYKEPKNITNDTYPLGDNQYMKKRSKPYLINHYKHNKDQNPEEFYHALLLMFKPWREPSELLAGKCTYTEAFEAQKPELQEALRYAEIQTNLKTTIDKAFAEIDSKIIELQEAGDQVEEHHMEGPDHPDQFQLEQTDLALNDLREINIAAQNEPDANILVNQLNSDQLRVFNHVTKCMTSSNQVLRHFVTGTGGTGKSFLITTIKTWVAQTLNSQVAVCAPTGVAAFNINGLTIYRLLQLPVEHGAIPKYNFLSDSSLKKFRTELNNTQLFIIDEVSMVSNLMLLYINLRLNEIFGTSDDENGWFGRKHILFFGDLLQLPPVHEQPPYIQLLSKDVEKYVGSLHIINIWTELFTYDELEINMRQKDDADFVNTLNRVRLGALNQDDIKLLQTRVLRFESESVIGHMEKVVKCLKRLPSDTICLMPTKHMCQSLNTAMMCSLDTPQNSLLAEDSLDCSKFMKQRAEKLLKRQNEDSSNTAGLDDVIEIKLGSKVMLRRSIDVTRGLVNGSIGVLTKINWDPTQPKRAKSLVIKYNHGLQHELERVKAKFMLMKNVFVHRSQFPITVAYAITIHKSQGLSLNNVLLDIGSNVFTFGQAYVALSRVTKLQGLHLINFDPSQVKALSSAVSEINRLRAKYRPELQSINIVQKKHRKVTDKKWSNVKVIDDIQKEDYTKPQRKRKKLKKN